jgi:hypothetical protein
MATATLRLLAALSRHASLLFIATYAVTPITSPYSAKSSYVSYFVKV